MSDAQWVSLIKQTSLMGDYEEISVPSNDVEQYRSEGWMTKLEYLKNVMGLDLVEMIDKVKRGDK